MRFDGYAFFIGLALAIVIWPTFETLRKFDWPLRRINLFMLTAGVLIFASAQYFGTLGQYLATGHWTRGPTSVMGLLVVCTLIGRTWGVTHGETGLTLLKQWSYVLPLAQSVGRIGCWCAGCCFVKSPHTFSWPLLEASGCFLIAMGLYCLRDNPKLQRPGALFSVYLLTYLVMRFGLEFLRGDLIRGSVNGFSLPQWICLTLISWLFLDYRRVRHHN